MKINFRQLKKVKSKNSALYWYFMNRYSDNNDTRPKLDQVQSRRFWGSYLRTVHFRWSYTLTVHFTSMDNPNWPKTSRKMAFHNKNRFIMNKRSKLLIAKFFRNIFTNMMILVIFCYEHKITFFFVKHNKLCFLSKNGLVLGFCGVTS